MSNEIKFTPSQLSAIEVQAEKILVSAAAGSGKSTVLTERIIRAVTDESRCYDLQKLMVVTFTRASAEDLKSKITKAIKDAVEANPCKHLSQQLMKLPSAKINTIHGICYSLIKANFEALELPASLSVADENAITSLKIEVLSDFLDYCYSGLFSPIQNFDIFVENFVTERDDNLVNTLLQIYDKIKNCPNGLDALSENLIESTSDFFSTPYGTVVYQRLKMLIDYYAKVFENALKYSKHNPDYIEYVPLYGDLVEFLRRLNCAAEQKSFTVIADTINKTLPIRISCPPVSKNLATEEAEYYKAERSDFYLEITKLKDKIFTYTDGELKALSTQNAYISKTLIAFINEFDRRFTQAKLKRSFLDFNDLEHYTLKLLYDENGNISDFAKKYSSELTEIYVDEYQDLNPLQNKIFTALSVNCPIFMVGDIKQSIYGFRGADPSAFAEYKRNFPEYTPKQNTYKNVTVFLSENFRSLDPILSFTNSVSDEMFYTPENSEGVYSYRIPYSVGDKLKAGKIEPKPHPGITFLNYEPVNVKGGNPLKSASVHYQARIVGSEIKRLINDEGVNPSDIAIIMRALKNAGPIFQEEFKKLDIPLDVSTGKKLFDLPEIQLALCLLNCCDNPYRDIFLAGALKSPVFSFSLSDLINIRSSDKNASSLFEALCSYTEKYDFEKGRFFLSFLEKMRKFAMENTVDKLLWRIYEQTHFFSLIYDGTVTKDGAKARRANLLLLHEMAKSMTGSGKSGLYEFVESIRLLTEQGNSPNAAVTDGNGVKIMSMHASKGLEFPYCFVCGTSTVQKNDDLGKDILFDEKIGFAVKIKDELRLSTSDTPLRMAIQLKAEAEWIDEEMRMLYVALTRARKKLYICSSESKFNQKKLSGKFNANNINPYFYIKEKSYINWILTGIARDNDSIEICDFYSFTKEKVDEIIKALPNTLPSSDKITMTPEQSNELYEDIKARLTFNYPHKDALILPSKISVSSLVPDIIDKLYENTLSIGNDLSKFDLANLNSDTKDSSTKLSIPRFMSGEPAISGSDIGTATHIFMQFCDFNLLSENGIESEIKRLCDKRFIPQHLAALIDRAAIEKFLKSEIYSEMINAKEINREYRFNIKLSARDFTTNEKLKQALDGEYIFVQGVIDCYFYDSYGNITLLDYKTDFVPKSILGNTEKENGFFTKHYSKQLGYYKKALEILTGRRINKTLIYSFSLSRCIEI